jgi:hypothetical protein
MASKDQLEYGSRDGIIYAQRAILIIYSSIYPLFFNSALNIGLFTEAHPATWRKLHETI